MKSPVYAWLSGGWRTGSKPAATKAKGPDGVTQQEDADQFRQYHVSVAKNVLRAWPQHGIEGVEEELGHLLTGLALTFAASRKVVVEADSDFRLIQRRVLDRNKADYIAQTLVSDLLACRHQVPATYARMVASYSPSFVRRACLEATGSEPPLNEEYERLFGERRYLFMGY